MERSLQSDCLIIINGENNRMQEEKKSFIGYEYMEITVDTNLASMYLDCYENFGWVGEKELSDRKKPHRVIIRMKRDRKIMNKMELTRLQRNFEACAIDMGRLEKAKTTAAIYLGKENVKIQELPYPECGDNDVIIENIYSSICGTDVAVFLHGPNTGHRITVGGEFGHETISRIVEVGKNVTEFKVGERVFPYPRYAKNDTKRAGTIGGFSEYILVPEAKRNHSLYAVNENISDRLACLIEPFTVGCRAARRGQPKPGEHAVVFGCGTIGIAAAVALKYFGVSKVMICDVSEFRLKIAKELGFEVFHMKHENFKEKAIEYFGTAPSIKGETADIDCFIDAAGAESILDLFMEHGKIESRFVSVAVNNAIRKLDLLHMTYSQKSLIGSGGYMPEDVEDVINIMASGKWNLESIITHEFPLEQIEEAIRTAADTNRALNVTIKF